jgi:type 1 glutamine amidotransferase
VSRNLLLSGGPGHEFDELADALARLLRADGIETTVVTEPEKMLAELAAGDRGSAAAYDLLTVHALWWGMGADRFAALRAEQAYTLGADDAEVIDGFVRSGGGLLALHSAVICFDAEPTWHALCGASWNWDASSHPPVGEADVAVTDAGRVHSLTTGLEGFTVHDEIYGFLDEEPALSPLLTSSHGGRAHPVLWARDLGEGRVVTDLLGHGPESLADPTHRTILRRAANWARRGSPDGR